jgi:histidinol-phosphate aminotransferase
VAYNQYPEYAVATAAVAELWHCQPEQVLLTNGSDEALFIIPFTFLQPKDTVLISQPTFQMIPHYLHLCRAAIQAIPLQENTLALDILAWDNALNTLAPAMVVLPSPDNPSGAQIDPAIWQRWLSEHRDTQFVLDQAYAEYEPAADTAFLPLLHNNPNLLITRTFSKAWGLAALRLGVILGPADLIHWLQKVRSPFSVNAAAVDAVMALLPKAADIKAQALQACKRKQQLIQDLTQRGFVVHPAGGNFLLLHVGLDAELFTQHMAQHNVLVRDRSQVPGMWGYVRVSVGTEQECAAFLAAVENYQQNTVLMFDLDDTLIDTSMSFDTVVMELVERFSHAPLDRQALYALRSEGGFNDDWVAIHTLLNRRGITGISKETIAQAGTQLYLERAKQTEHLILPVEQLKRLKRRFPKLAIATGRYRQEYDRVWADTLNPIFTHVVCIDDDLNYVSKPDPSSLLAAMALTQTTQGVYVGNSIDDMRAALAANLLAVGVVKTMSQNQLQQAGACHVMTTIEDIMQVFPSVYTASIN